MGDVSTLAQSRWVAAIPPVSYRSSLSAEKDVASSWAQLISGARDAASLARAAAVDSHKKPSRLQVPHSSGNTIFQPPAERREGPSDFYGQCQTNHGALASIEEDQCGAAAMVVSSSLGTSEREVESHWKWAFKALEQRNRELSSENEVLQQKVKDLEEATTSALSALSERIAADAKPRHAGDTLSTARAGYERGALHDQGARPSFPPLVRASRSTTDDGPGIAGSPHRRPQGRLAALPRGTEGAHRGPQAEEDGLNQANVQVQTRSRTSCSSYAGLHERAQQVAVPAPIRRTRRRQASPTGESAVNDPTTHAAPTGESPPSNESPTSQLPPPPVPDSPKRVRQSHGGRRFRSRASPPKASEPAQEVVRIAPSRREVHKAYAAQQRDAASRRPSLIALPQIPCRTGVNPCSCSPAQDERNEKAQGTGTRSDDRPMQHANPQGNHRGVQSGGPCTSQRGESVITNTLLDDEKLDYDGFCRACAQLQPKRQRSSEELSRRFKELRPADSTVHDVSSPRGGFVYLQDLRLTHLFESLSRACGRVIDLFRSWDQDGSASIDLSEFGRALRKLGFRYSDADVRLVFEHLDEDGSGFVDYVELNAKLRPKTMARNMHKLRTDVQLKRGASRVQSLVGKKQLDTSEGAAPLEEQLQQLMKQNFLKIHDVFRMWDVDEDGTVSRKEFADAIRALGYDAPREAIDAVFDSFDEDGSGMVDYHEVYRLLRAGRKVHDQIRGHAKRVSRPPDVQSHAHAGEEQRLATVSPKATNSDGGKEAIDELEPTPLLAGTSTLVSSNTAIGEDLHGPPAVPNVVMTDGAEPASVELPGDSGLIPTAASMQQMDSDDTLLADSGNAQALSQPGVEASGAALQSGSLMESCPVPSEPDPANRSNLDNDAADDDAIEHENQESAPE